MMLVRQGLSVGAELALVLPRPLQIGELAGATEKPVGAFEGRFGHAGVHHGRYAAFEVVEHQVSARRAGDGVTVVASIAGRDVHVHVDSDHSPIEIRIRALELVQPHYLDQLMPGHIPRNNLGFRDQRLGSRAIRDLLLLPRVDRNRADQGRKDDE